MPEDPYTDAKTGVLRNKLGLSDAATLEVAETKFSTLRDTEIASNPIPGMYDLAHLRAFHRHLFGDVYSWAGELRTVEIAKGSTRFCLVTHLETYAADTVFPMVTRSNYLRGLDQGDVVTALAAQLAELNMLHPFREGNGRAQRVFLRQMAAAAGWRIDWAAADPEENVAACVEAVVGTCDLLEAMFARLVTPITGQ